MRFIEGNLFFLYEWRKLIKVGTCFRGFKKRNLFIFKLLVKHLKNKFLKF